MLDPDPDEMNADPQPCLQPLFLLFKLLLFPAGQPLPPIRLQPLLAQVKENILHIRFVQISGLIPQLFCPFQLSQQSHVLLPYLFELYMKAMVLILLLREALSQFFQVLLQVGNKLVCVFALRCFGLQSGPQLSHLLYSGKAFDVGFQAVDAFQRLSVLLLKIPVGGLTTRYFLGELQRLRFNLPKGKEKKKVTLKMITVADKKNSMNPRYKL
jgi:hypothetical protein